MERAKIKSFTDLIAWTKASDLVISVYTTLRAFPNSEKYGLVSQIQRAAVSVPANIAEGFSRISFKEKVQFYAIAHGSLTELQSHLSLSLRLKFINNSNYTNLLNQSIEVSKLINGLIKSVRKAS